MKLSAFGRKLSGQSDIVDLMQDLGEALNSNPDLLFLGGGNPTQIPAAEKIFQKASERIKNSQIEKDSFGVYSSPTGHPVLLESLCRYFNEKCHWPVTERNIAIANGSQVASFILLNMFAGRSETTDLKICLPLVPEYMGYADQGIEDGLFKPIKPKISLSAEHRFKYQIDFDALDSCDDLGALCLSRPTNPSGNVLDKVQIEQLKRIATEKNIPLIIDNAYGLPFPGIMERGQGVAWSEPLVYLLSTSKLGLPGLRCSIVVANEEIIDLFVRANTTINLANANPGQVLLKELLDSGDIDQLSENILPDFYAEKRKHCVKIIDRELATINYRIHEPDGAFFVWLWIEDLPISSTELYGLLKKEGVLVIDGQPFFFNVDYEWLHARQCIRISFCQDENMVEQGIVKLGQLLNKLQC